MIGPELGRDSRSRGADAIHLVVIGLPGRGVCPGVTGRACLPARRFPQPTSAGASHAAWPRAATGGQPGPAPVAAPVPPGDWLGILTEAILAGRAR